MAFAVARKWPLRQRFALPPPHRLATGRVWTRLAHYRTSPLRSNGEGDRSAGRLIGGGATDSGSEVIFPFFPAAASSLQRLAPPPLAPRAVPPSASLTGRFRGRPQWANINVVIDRNHRVARMSALGGKRTLGRDEVERPEDTPNDAPPQHPLGRERRRLPEEHTGYGRQRQENADDRHGDRLRHPCCIAG